MLFARNVPASARTTVAIIMATSPMITTMIVGRHAATGMTTDRIDVCVANRMAHVIITDYEIAHDLLPRVCAKCGQPANRRMKLGLRTIDGWRGAFQVVGLAFGLFCFPPLVLRIIRRY